LDIRTLPVRRFRRAAQSEIHSFANAIRFQEESFTRGAERKALAMARRACRRGFNSTILIARWIWDHDSRWRKLRAGASGRVGLILACDIFWRSTGWGTV